MVLTDDARHDSEQRNTQLLVVFPTNEWCEQKSTPLENKNVFLPHTHTPKDAAATGGGDSGNKAATGAAAAQSAPHS